MPQSKEEHSRTLLLDELARDFSLHGIRRRRRSHFWHSRSSLYTRHLSDNLRRLLETTLAASLLLAFSPALLILFVWAKAAGGKIGHRQVLGRQAIPFPLFQFEFPNPQTAPCWANTLLAKIPALWNAARGEMSFIGPRPVPSKEFSASERNAWKRYDLRPGFLSVWWLRRRGNIDYTCETDLDAEYVETRTFRGDLGIALRALPALTYGKTSSDGPGQVTILGIPISNLSLAEAANQIIRLAASNRPSQVCFVNADCANAAHRDQAYMGVLERSDLILADGIGMRLAGQFLKKPIRQNVNGTDLLPVLCSAAAASGLGIYLLGGRPGVAEATAGWMRAQAPSLEICGTRHGFFRPHEELAIVQAIQDSKARILLVALGAPKQDLWIDTHKASLPPGVSIGVGGLFDFYSGTIPRAPVWMREIGMEWFFRFLQEPGRMWRRYFLGNALFLLRVLNQRIRKS